ncbi:heme-binding protein [Lacisediminihabitans profunda]|uniref:Heme-binding protein n=1 Tax=Lacisediminihabitans profunda TaxID=2594790 RepID=A0A5C8UTG0_9MICO|nr:heme-binding protein [Lacisediminihabitans profunda]
MTLDIAEQLITAAHRHATALEVNVSIAVVDSGGHLVAFQRMDGAEIAGPTLAVDKAYTAVAQSVSTAELAILAAPGGPLFGLHANGNGRYVIFGGGVPLHDGPVIVGGIGVSGASAAEDHDCAHAAKRLFDGQRPAQAGFDEEH